jgi:dihydrofolate reductase
MSKFDDLGQMIGDFAERAREGVNEAATSIKKVVDEEKYEYEKNKIFRLHGKNIYEAYMQNADTQQFIALMAEEIAALNKTTFGEEAGR